MTAGELAETAAQCLAAGADALPDASRPRLLFVLERYAISGEPARDLEPLR